LWNSSHLDHIFLWLCFPCIFFSLSGLLIDSSSGVLQVYWKVLVDFKNLCIYGVGFNVKWNKWNTLEDMLNSALVYNLNFSQDENPFERKYINKLEKLLSKRSSNKLKCKFLKLSFFFSLIKANYKASILANHLWLTQVFSRPFLAHSSISP